MHQNDTAPATTDTYTNNVLAAAVTAAAVTAVLAVSIYALHFASGGLADDPERWGQFGDYFGGVVNPVVGLITVFLVVMSISIQRKELKVSLNEMKNANIAAQKMSFEQFDAQKAEVPTTSEQNPGCGPSSSDLQITPLHVQCRLFEKEGKRAHDCC